MGVSPSPADVAAAAERARAAGEGLRDLPLARRCRALAAAAAALADPGHPLGREAREALPGTTGLSPAMVEWALRTSLGPFSEDALADLARRALAAGAPRLPVPPRLVAVVLAGNLFTAALRPLVFPLALGAPVVAKASSRDDRFPRLLAGAIREADPEVGAAVEVLTFPGGEDALERALFAASDTVVVYGGDRTVAAVRSRLPPRVRLLEHGHGIGAAYVGRAALAGEAGAASAAERLATDVAAYDQRGCLSPYAVWVEEGGAVSPARFAELADRALAALADPLPRGPLPAEVAAAAMQWRGVAIARGRLLEGAGHAVALLDDDTLAAGPGWRNLAVFPSRGVEGFARRMAAWGVHLKAVGVAGGEELRARLAAALPPPLCPRICPLGAMQIPPLAAAEDGLPPMAGLLSWLELDPPL